MARFFGLALLLIASAESTSVQRAPFCIPRGGAGAGYSAQLEGVKSTVMDKATAAVSSHMCVPNCYHSQVLCVSSNLTYFCCHHSLHI
jgi:hypothetical protein